MWMRSIISLSCCVFPPRSRDLPEASCCTTRTLITGNTKTCQRAWVDLERKSVPRRKWKSPHSHQQWTIQYARISWAAWRRLNTLQSRWTSSEVQRAESLLSTNPLGVWVTEKGEVHSIHADTHMHTVLNQIAFFFKKTAEIWFLVLWPLHLGSVILAWKRASIFTDGRADVGRGLFRAGFLITWPVFSACGKVWNVENSLSDGVQLV